MAGEPVAGTGLTAVTGGLAGAEGGPLEWTTTADGLKDTLVKIHSETGRLEWLESQ